MISKKIKRYIKIAEKECLDDNKAYTVEGLYKWLDLFIIPCCSMSKTEQSDLKMGLKNMVNGIQLKMF